MKRFPIILLTTSLFISFCATADPATAEKIKLSLAKSMPHITPDKISESPVKGMYEVVVGSQVVYTSSDGRYMIQGDLYDLDTKENISEAAKSNVRLLAINKLGEDNMVVYKPDTVKNVITVVTDIDCPYCRRLHSEIEDYMAQDVEVRYIFMPLKGDADVKKTVSVWCADNQQEALNTAKAGGKIEDKTCDNPIKEHIATARELGVRGTPAIVLEDGQLLPGYVPAAKLVAQLRQ